MSTKKRNDKNPKIVNRINLVKHPSENKFILDVPTLTEDQLPKISIITITKNRKHMFNMPIYNWKNFMYPQDKLEWIIVDDSDKNDQDLTDMLDMTDKRIKYIKINSKKFKKCENGFKYTDLGEKRNYAIEHSTGEYIVIMDDDDYYFSDSIMAKIRILKHTKLECGFSLPYGVYNTSRKTSHIVGDCKRLSNGQVPEASLFFTKSFWEKQKFKHKLLSAKGVVTKLGEAYGLINSREKKIVCIPFWINLIAITHKENLTGNLRQYHVEENLDNNRASFYDYFNKDIQEIISSWESN